MTIRPTHHDGTPLTIREQLERSAGRKAKRAEKGLALGLRKPRPQRVQPIAALSARGAVKKDIVRLLGLLSRAKYGPGCRYGALCPRFKKVGAHPGDTACHVVPQMRGDAARFVPENVVWGCRDANRGEQMNRSLYRDIHIAMFGAAYVERIEVIARGTADYSDADLREFRATLRKQLTGTRP